MPVSSSFIANTKIKIGQQDYWVQDAGQDYSITQSATDAYRFEVRAGDVWSAIDPNSINRSEFSSTRLIANGTPIHVAYTMNLEQGAANSANWTVLGQFHQNDVPNAPSNSPPFSINMNGEKMSVNVVYTSALGVSTSLNVFSDTADIIRGHDYAMDINVVFDPNGNGRLILTRDGVKIVDYSGPLGYDTQQSVYWKEGIYRAASTETLAVTYSNLVLDTSAAIASATLKSAGPQTVNQYSNTGDILSSTAFIYDAIGNIVQKTITTLNKGSDVFEYGVTGKSYTSSYTSYDSSGSVNKLIRYHADGSLDYQQIKTIDGTATTSFYDSLGALIDFQITQPDGSRAVSSYLVGQINPQSYVTYNSAGQIIFSQVLNADGSKTIRHGGIVGQAYTSDLMEYDATGRLYLLKQFYANGNVSFLQNVSVNGVITVTNYDSLGGINSVLVTQTDGSKSLSTYGIDKTRPASYQTYDAAGKLTLNDIFNADGTRKTQHFGIIGQAYTSDTLDFDATGKLVLLRQFHVDGSLSYQQSVSDTGVKTYTNYDAIGGIINQNSVKADGSRSLTSYGVDKTRPASLLTYDIAGKLTLNQTYDAAGKITLNDIFNADGTRKTQHFGITGQAYTSDTFDYDATGKLVLLRQFHSDGSLNYQQSLSSTGVKTYTSFDAVGGIINRNAVKVDGSRSLTTYGVDKTRPASLFTYDISGKMTLHQDYDAIGKTILNDIFNADGTRKTQHFGITGQAYTSDTFDYDATGKLTLLRQFHADGSLSYQQSVSSSGVKVYTNYDAVGGIINQNSVKADGSRSLTTYGADKTRPASLLTYDIAGKLTLNQTYDSAGKIILNDIFNADGTRKTQHFGIAGQAYTSDTIDYDASNRMLSNRQYHSDGTLHYSYSTNTNGSSNVTNYDAAGQIIQNVTTNLDGSKIGKAWASSATFVSGAGNDVFTSFQADTFIFSGHSGNDIIYGFNAGDSAIRDVIQLDKTLVQDFFNLQLTQFGSDLSIRVTDVDSITLKNVSLPSLTAQNFSFF
jgi:hypothetical protein